MLWIDDQIERYRPWVQAFTDSGVAVETETNLSDGIERLHANRFEVVMIDAMLGHESCVPALESITKYLNGARLFVCSGFFYLNDVLQETRSLKDRADTPIGTIDKTLLPFVDDPKGISEFLTEIMSDESPDVVAEVDDDEPTSPLDKESLPTWEEYLDYPVNIRLRLSDRVASLTKELRKELFAKGAKYVLFCGRLDKPEIIRNSLNDALDEREVIDIARTLNSAPFPFSWSGEIDDLSKDCCEFSGLKGYPVLKVSSGGKSESMHFDTGNSYSLLSYEWFLEHGWFDPSLFIQIHGAGDLEFKGRRLKLDKVIHTDGAGATKSGTLNAFAAMNWDTYRLATRCGSQCKNPNKLGGASELCAFRRGLLGRNLPLDLDVNLRIDFTTGEIIFA